MKTIIAMLGLMEYGKALELQEKLLGMRQKGIIDDVLLLVEHPPVLTLGRRGVYSNIVIPEEQLRQSGVGIFEVNRGGDVTYHGPGQIVGYPVIDLGGYDRDIHRFVSGLQNIFISLLNDLYSIQAHKGEGKYTGVWVGDEKITAIGIAVKKWVTMHGFAFNVNTELEHFKWIVPCGITDKGVTSVKKLTGEIQDFNYLNAKTADYFCRIFNTEPVFKSRQEIMEMAGISE